MDRRKLGHSGLTAPVAADFAEGADSKSSFDLFLSAAYGDRSIMDGMSNNLADGIWPPHEVFYIESLLYSTGLALRAADEVRAALDLGHECDPSSPEWQECAFTIISSVQTLVVQAGAVSRYFWPARAREPHLSRARRLKTSLDVTEDSPLKSRHLRNRLEHLDEQLDDFCKRLIAGVILPTYVGPLRTESEVSTHLFRAYYTDVGVFEILGHRFEIQPLLDELRFLHNRLVLCAENGGRLPGT